MTSNLKDLANSYFVAWESKEFETLRSLLEDTATLHWPLGRAKGAEDFVKNLKKLLEIASATEIKLQHILVDKFDICVRFDLYTEKTIKPLDIVNWFKVENGKIREGQMIFDPRPLIFPFLTSSCPSGISEWYHRCAQRRDIKQLYENRYGKGSHMSDLSKAMLIFNISHDSDSSPILDDNPIKLELYHRIKTIGQEYYSSFPIIWPIIS